MALRKKSTLHIGRFRRLSVLIYPVLLPPLYQGCLLNFLKLKTIEPGVCLSVTQNRQPLSEDERIYAHALPQDAGG